LDTSHPKPDFAAKKPGYLIISGKRVYTLPPKPPAEMLRLTLHNKDKS
jgi:hypothetical protein